MDRPDGICHSGYAADARDRLMDKVIVAPRFLDDLRVPANYRTKEAENG